MIERVKAAQKNVLGVIQARHLKVRRAQSAAWAKMLRVNLDWIEYGCIGKEIAKICGNWKARKDLEACSDDGKVVHT
jgi:hypothetical protein